MKKEFISKMIKAKKLEFEAIQELFPDKIKENMDEMNEVVKELAKEFAMEIYFSNKTGFNKEDGLNNQNTGINKETGEKQVKKIIIE